MSHFSSLIHTHKIEDRIQALRKVRIRRLRQSYEELLMLYTEETGKGANEVYAVEVLQWIIVQDNVGK